MELPTDPVVSCESVPMTNETEQSLRTAQSHPKMSKKADLAGNAMSLGSIPVGGITFRTPREKRSSLSANNSSSSPNSLQVQNEDEYEEEEGAHDTITSLAGAKMLQRYRKHISGSSRKSSLNQNRLEDLFLINEDEKEVEDELQEQPPALPEAEDDVFIPPDGGYGWFVALGAFIALFWTAGMVKSYGVIFDSILLTYKNASVSLAAWIPGSMTTFALATAPVTSALCQKFNCRWVTMAGSLLCFSGIVLSSFAPTIEVLFVTFGVLTGIGIGLSTTPGIIITARYFEKKRGIANAFCLSGTAAGSFVLPFIIESLLYHYGFKGTLLILGACMLNVCISAALYRPLAIHVLIMKRQSKANEEQAPPIVCSNEHQLHHHNGHHHHHHQHHHHYYHPVDPHEVVAKLRQHSCKHHFDDISICSSNQGTIPKVSSGNSLFNFRNESFGSLPCSLPPHLEYQFPLHDNSSLTSREDIQCNWSESRQSTTHELDPMQLLSEHPLADFDQQHHRLATGKALSLRELCIHQISNKFGIYKSILVSKLNRTPERHASACYLPTRGSQLNSRRHSIDHSLFAPTQRPKSKAGKQGVGRKRLSIMFSIEDMTTDSTSFLKDRRHPSVVSRDSLNRKPTLGRSLSSASKDNRRRVKRRRLISEGHDPITPGHSRLRLLPSEHFEHHRRVSKASSDLIEVIEENVKSEERVKEEEEEEEEEEDASTKYLDLTLCKDPLFWIMAGSVMAMSVGVPHVLFFLPSFVRSMDIGADPATLLSITSVADLFGRIVCGFVLDADIIPQHIAYASMIGMTSLSVLVLPFAYTYPGLIGVMLIYGLGSGCWFLMVPLLLAEFLGVERIGSSYGLVRLFQAGTNLTGPLIAGVIRDTTGSFAYAFVLMGSIMFIGSIIVLLKPLAEPLSVSSDKLNKSSSEA